MDLRIYYEDGTEYQPWVLNPANPSAPATRGDNFRDNVEQVYIDAPQRGYYTIEVSSKEAIEGFQQPFSMITSGQTDPLALDDPGHLVLSAPDETGFAFAPHSLTNGFFPTNKISIEFWVNFDASSDPDAIILTKKSSASETTSGYLLRTVGSGDERRLLWAPGSNPNWHIESNAGIRAGEWTHVAIVYDNGNSYIYFNGELDRESIRSSISIGNSETPLIIGARQNQNGQFFRGKLDDIRIWHGALPMLTIRENMRGPVAGDTQGLRSYYRFITRVHHQKTARTIGSFGHPWLRT
ncbi:MAG: LamG domain-containing protein [Dissulfuribacterales bacterium]